MDFKWIEADTNEEDFVPVHKESSIKCDATGDVKTNSNARKETENSVEKEEQKLLMCPDEGCHRTFQRYGALQNHMLYGRHEKKQEKITLIDRAKKGYARRLEMQYGVVPSKSSACVLLEEENHKVSEKGWALAQQKSKSKFNDRQKSYLTKKFEEGEKSGKKLKADEVAQDMRRVRDEMGRRVFTIEEFLTSKQVASFFSRLAAKKRSGTTSDNEAIEAEEIRKETRRVMIRALDSHPLTCEDVVLCEMSREKLHRLKLDKLKAICSHFGIDTQFSKKKIHYVDKLLEYMQSCECRV